MPPRGPKRTPGTLAPPLNFSLTLGRAWTPGAPVRKRLCWGKGLQGSCSASRWLRPVPRVSSAFLAGGRGRRGPLRAAANAEMSRAAGGGMPLPRRGLKQRRRPGTLGQAPRERSPSRGGRRLSPPGAGKLRQRPGRRPGKQRFSYGPRLSSSCLQAIQSLSPLISAFVTQKQPQATYKGMNVACPNKTAYERKSESHTISTRHEIFF